MLDYYNILGVESTASTAEIKVAFRTLAKLYHPDKNENGKDWKQETSITENNKTFDVYSGSIGDQTVQVKVEDKISDGITS